MKARHIIIAAAVSCAAIGAQAQDNKVTVHGSVQADMLFPETDYEIMDERYTSDFLGNFYANAGLFSKYVDAGLRVEYLEHPLPGFDPGFKGWGLANIFAKGKYKGFELTAGDFYEQFGSGFILRTYEERSLGVDNSIRGGRLKVSAIPGVRLTALGGVQRNYWDWDTKSQVYGADAEVDFQHFSQSLRDRGVIWSLGASYVLKHERDEDIVKPGQDKRLNLPRNVNAFDVRTQFNKGGWDVKAEFAWKSQDPSIDNKYTYRSGNAEMLSVSYSKPGWSAFLQGKRSYNMAFRSRRSRQNEDLLSCYINNMPAFTYQHTYTLAAMYPYATQSALGEWAFQGAYAYNFKRGTALGGRYGTKLKLNASYICGLDYDIDKTGTDLWGTDWHTSGSGGFGETYYTDINLQIEKKFSKVFTLNAMYMFQKYNKSVVEGEGGMVNCNILVGEGKFKLSRKYTLRTELQWLQTQDDQKDWLYGLAELSVLPYLMFSVSDQWNAGTTGTHYYMVSATCNFKNNRIMVGYGRTREGYNCSGGVCRFTPATKGLTISYNYNF